MKRQMFGHKHLAILLLLLLAGCDSTSPDDELQTQIPKDILTGSAWEVSEGDAFPVGTWLKFEDDSLLLTYNAGRATCEERSCSGSWGVDGNQLVVKACGPESRLTVQRVDSTRLSFETGAFVATTTQDYTEAAFGMNPSGISPTNEQGDVHSHDNWDWCPAPFFGHEVSMSPIFPNPLESGSATLPVETTRDGLVLCAFNASNEFVEVSQVQNAGLHRLEVDPASLEIRDGLVRLFLLTSDNYECGTVRRLVAYGDLMIN